MKIAGVFVASFNLMLSAVLGGGILGLVIIFLHVLLVKPRQLRSKLQRQGIKGPSPLLLYGNIPEMKRISGQASPANRLCEEGAAKISHSWPTTVYSHILQWRKEYGPIFLYSLGNVQILCVTDAPMIKEVSLCTSLNLGKPAYLSRDRGPLFGRGILSSNGSYWVHQKKIISPEFYLDKVKGFLDVIVDCTRAMLESWGRYEFVNPGGSQELRVDSELKKLSSDIISRACFGGHISAGENIFTKLGRLESIISKGSIGVMGLRHIPTKHNREIWRLEKEIKKMIMEVVNARSKISSDRDLLQLILGAAEGYENRKELWMEVTPKTFIVDNCKTFYFAGHESTALSASWALLLLAANQDWQTRARSEVLRFCGNNPPNVEMLRNMKVLTMVIQETLRLYPPLPYLMREALQDMDFNGIKIPKGVDIQIPIAVLHTDPEIWGPDANEFNPERFSEGVSKACKYPQVYLPFGLGTRTCIGQHFAMAELKVALSLILSRFEVSLSPAYLHSPVLGVVLEPEHGIYLQFKKI